jgi:magnesium-transporting ATPase (P-type)
LANTTWAIGAVVYTGLDTKLMLNYGLSRFKQSRIEKVVNVICVYLIAIELIFCLIMSVCSGFYVSNNAQLSSDGIRRKAEYLFYTEISTFGRSVNGTATDSGNVNYSSTTEGLMTFGVYFVLLNTLIPLSLVVSIEFIKLIQTPFIAHDAELFDGQISFKQATPMTMTLHEELASINYIFADKTGTLTANIMQFKACSIGSVCYDDDFKDEDYEYEIVDDNDLLGAYSTIFKLI